MIHFWLMDKIRDLNHFLEVFSQDFLNIELACESGLNVGIRVHQQESPNGQFCLLLVAPSTTSSSPLRHFPSCQRSTKWMETNGSSECDGQQGEKTQRKGTFFFLNKQKKVRIRKKHFFQTDHVGERYRQIPLLFLLESRPPKNDMTEAQAPTVIRENDLVCTQKTLACQLGLSKRQLKNIQYSDINVLTGWWFFATHLKKIFVKLEIFPK